MLTYVVHIHEHTLYHSILREISITPLSSRQFKVTKIVEKSIIVITALQRPTQDFQMVTFLPQLDTCFQDAAQPEGPPEPKGYLICGNLFAIEFVEIILYLKAYEG